MTAILGSLAYGGIDIHELADHSTFEETCYLLWNGKLPTEIMGVPRNIARQAWNNQAGIKYAVDTGESDLYISF